MENINDIDLDNELESIGISTESLKSINTKLKQEAISSGRMQEPAKAKESSKLVISLTEADRQLAVNMGLIPKAYKDARFDTDRIRENIKEQFTKSKKMYHVIRYREYTDICNNILSTVRMKLLPERSYIIGAPNGFGKTSFVTECLITLNKQGYRVAPYISLLELAQIRVDNEHRMMKPFRKFRLDEEPSTGIEKLEYYTEPNVSPGYMKKPEIVTGCYSYSEYINADCLFVHLTDVQSKDIESHALYQLLSIRGVKGLPTIVMTGQSLEIYERDVKLREIVWDEIRTYNKNTAYFDRLYHISCFKTKNLGLEYKNGEVDEETGIVESQETETR